MSPYIILTIFLAYTALIFFITYITSRKANHDTFYRGNKVSPWYVVAYGMIGASLSGVTFMSVPGWVSSTHFTYLVLVAGYLVGYAVIATILLPLYYRLNLTSIYTYLEQRFGFWTYKSGAAFFMLSRTIGASLRLFLVVNVMQVFVFDAWNIPFWANVAIFITLIILYTFKGGIKTIVWTDTLQTTFMLGAVVLCIHYILKDLNVDFGTMVNTVLQSDYSKIIETDWHNKTYFLKHFLGGAFIAISMTGLDQEMMQKNLSCRNVKESQINMIIFSWILVFINMMFLFLGAILNIYAASQSIDTMGSTDNLFPAIAINHLTPVAGIVFLIGLISAAYPSADGALTSLTTSFTIDFLGLPHHKGLTDAQKRKIRYGVHIGIASIFFMLILFFRTVNDKAVIDKIFTLAGYTYGPLLGLFACGLFTKWKLKDQLVPVIVILSPVLTHILNYNSVKWFSGYVFGFELIIVNGLLTFIGLLFIRKRDDSLVR
jgi:Na+/proline symporter